MEKVWNMVEHSGTQDPGSLRTLVDQVINHLSAKVLLETLVSPWHLVVNP